MTDPKRPQSWSPQYENDREAGKEQSAPLLKDGVKPEVADQAAEAIRHVMSGVRPPEGASPSCLCERIYCFLRSLLDPPKFSGQIRLLLHGSSALNHLSNSSNTSDVLLEVYYNRQDLYLRGQSVSSYSRHSIDAEYVVTVHVSQIQVCVDLFRPGSRSTGVAVPRHDDSLRQSLAVIHNHSGCQAILKRFQRSCSERPCLRLTFVHDLQIPNLIQP